MYPKEKKGKLEVRGDIIPFLIYSVKMTALADPSCVLFSSPSWSWVSPGTITPTSLRQMKPALLLFINSITDQEEGEEGNPLVLLQNWFFFAPCVAVQMHTNDFSFPRLPVRMGLKQPLLTHPLVFICVPHKTWESCY